MSVETIKKRLKIIADLQEELNKAQGALDEKLEDDPNYQKFQEEKMKVQEDTKVKMEKIMSNSMVKNMDEALKDVRKQIKENKEILAFELVDYYRESGTFEITDDEGNTRRIVFSAKLVK